MADTDSAPRGAEKKEAFHASAEANVRPFTFEPPALELLSGVGKIHNKLAGTNSCRAQIQVLHEGGDNNLHYHPNMDLIYMVLKGRVEFYGLGDKVIGDLGPYDGILLPENSRYWFKSSSSEPAWLLQIAGFPKGARAAKRISCEPEKRRGGVTLGVKEGEPETKIIPFGQEA
jgi:mannose-6-phosphate isomerase-like protein (cupin superfamily)